MSLGSTERLWGSVLYGSEYHWLGFTILPCACIRDWSLRSKHIADRSCAQAIGGAVWHGVKGFRNSPYGERRIGALTAIKARAPVLGGNFGVWGGLFSTFDCAVKGVRKKEDPYNASMYSLLDSADGTSVTWMLTISSHCRFLHRRCFSC